MQPWTGLQECRHKVLPARKITTIKESGMLNISRIPNSWLISFALALAIALFLVTADVTDISAAPSENSDLSQQSFEEPAEESALPTVVAVPIKSELITRTLSLYGRTSPDRIITLRSEIPARVDIVSATRGEMLKPGQDIVRLREGSLPAQLEYARSLLKQTQQEYDSSLSLRKKNHIAENRLNELEVAVAQARSNLRELEVEQENTQIKSPVTGILNKRFVEKGDFLEKGKEIAEVIDLDPLIIQVDVPQNIVARFSKGNKAQIQLENMPAAEAEIRFIDREANEATRTFMVELALPNPGMRIPSGMSARAELFIDEVHAIEVSPAFLSLSDDGELGIKWLDGNNQVHFTLAEIVKADTNSFWLSGVPDQARIITIGHGFVRPGDRVQVSSDENQFLAGD